MESALRQKLCYWKLAVFLIQEETKQSLIEFDEYLNGFFVLILIDDFFQS